MIYSFHFHAETNIMCILLLAMMLFFVLRSSEKKENRILLANTVLGMILTCISSIFHCYSMNRTTSLGAEGIYLFYILYCISQMSVGCFWFLYSESLLETKMVSSRKNRIGMSIPFAAFSVLIALTPVTGWFISVQKNATGYAVTRGAADGLSFGVMFVYVIITAFHAWIRAAREERAMEKKTYFMTGTFPLSFLILGAFQVFHPNAPSLCYGFVICILLTYITNQDNKISTDPLTKLNNRNQLNKYMLSEMRNPEIKEHLYLMIFDIDKFKQINDKFGHVEGDRALVKMTDILKKAVKHSNYRNFIARFGGDEFIIVTEAWDELQRIVKRIRELEDETNASGEYPYELSISMGYAKYEINMTGIQQWIDTADEMLYKEKKVKERERKISMR